MLAGRVITDPLDPTRWSDRLIAQLHAFRRALLAHRVGARVFGF
jgi:Tetracyclin repressor-like, C-terminal domain